MMDKSKEIQAKHLHTDAKGKDAFIKSDMKHADGQARLCYWPDEMTVHELHTEVVKAKQEEHKLMI